MKISCLVLTLAWAAATSAAELPPTEMSKPLPEFSRKPLVRDYYPATARALGQQGTVTLRLCYDEQGRVTASTLAQSSTFERLDQAALKMGRAYRIKPNLINGQPQPGCALVPVEFSLEEAVEPAGRREGVNGNRPLLPPPPPPPLRQPLPTLPPPGPTPRLVPLISGTGERSYTVHGLPVVRYAGRWAVRDMSGARGTTPL